VADYHQDRIQKFSETGKFLLQWDTAGAGDEQFNSPTGLAADTAGRVYVADFYNKSIKIFDAQGKFLQIIGHPGQWGLGALD
jgi:DNA-binding beta-propeller fold protein YncE